MIGSFGDIVFSTSSNLLQTFANFQRSSSARWGSQEVLNGRVKSQFMGPGQDSVTFDMTFNASFGVHPRKQTSKITSMCRDGEVHSLIIGGLPLGFDKWYIETINNRWDTIDNRGNLLSATVNVTLKEYV